MHIYPDYGGSRRYSVRDKDSTRYVGAVESCEEFGRRLYAEALRRGWGRRDKKIVLGDGSELITEPGEPPLSRCHLLSSISITAGSISGGGKAYCQNEAAPKRWVMVEQDKLDAGKIEELVGALRCRVARVSSAGSNDRACSGRFAAPMPSLPSAADSSAANSKITGRPSRERA